MSIEALNWALEHLEAETCDLSTPSRFVLLLLANRADPENGECRPGAKYIMKRTGLAERTVRASVKDLRDRRLLIIEERTRENGSTTTNTYRLALGGITPPPPAPDAPAPLQEMHPPPAPDAPPSTKGLDVPLSLKEVGGGDEKPKKRKADPYAGFITGPVLISLPTNNGVTFDVRQSLVDAMAKIYPAVDVPQTFNEMYGWLLANPTNRKTMDGMMRFINRWMSKEQNGG